MHFVYFLEIVCPASLNNDKELFNKSNEHRRNITEPAILGAVFSKMGCYFSAHLVNKAPSRFAIIR